MGFLTAVFVLLCAFCWVIVMMAQMGLLRGAKGDGAKDDASAGRAGQRFSPGARILRSVVRGRAQNEVHDVRSVNEVHDVRKVGNLGRLDRTRAFRQAMREASRRKN